MRNLAILLYFTLIHIFALLIFSNGFLLTRISLDNQSISSHTQSPAVFQKAVILIIDALRFDFVSPQNGTSRYWNHLKTPARIAVESPKHAFLTKFIADPPTTTLQRLKGLTTGSLPTFVDAGSNFAGEAITEDNLMSQIKKSGKRVAFVGDDTWQALFPDTFEDHLNFPFESLNVWDLDTVDDGVYNHLFTNRTAFFHEDIRSQWDFVVAHALGLDHSGHTYGPDHPETTRKLLQMDQWIDSLIDHIDDDTLLIVMGDHGMNSQGDHGGDSRDEVEAALFMYARKPVFGGSDMDEVAQIDFVSTFSLLLGLPIPFNNLGAPILQAFVANTIVNYNQALALTTSQIRDYLAVYCQHSTSIKAALESIDQRLRDDSREWQREVLKLLRYHWAQYEMGFITFGICLMSNAILLALSLYSRSSCFTSNTLAISYSAILLWTIQSKRAVIPNSYIYFGVISSVLLYCLYCYSDPQITDHIDRPSKSSRSGIVAGSVLLLHTAIFASNSFTIHEDRLSLYFLSTLLISYGLLNIQPLLLNPRCWQIYTELGTVLILSRVISSVRNCREEQIGTCISNFHSLPSWTTFVAFPIVLILFLSVVFAMMQANHNTTKPSNRWILTSILYSGLSIWTYWLLDHLNSPTSMKIRLARILVVVALGQAASWYWLPLPMDFRVRAGVLVVEGSDNVVTSSFLQLLLPITFLFVFLGRSVGSLSLLILVLQLLLLTDIFTSGINTDASRNNLMKLLILVELGFLHFFSTGHQMALPFIQWDLAFLLSKSIQYPISPILVAGNAFASFIIICLWTPLIVQWKTPVSHVISNSLQNSYPSQARTAHLASRGIVPSTILGIQAILSILTMSTMVFATHFRRHLMVWKIFAPRYMCASLILLLADVSFIMATLAISLRDWKVSSLVKLLASGS